MIGSSLQSKAAIGNFEAKPPQWEKDGMRVKPLTSVLSRKGRGCSLPKLSCNNLLKGEETGVKPG